MRLLRGGVFLMGTASSLTHHSHPAALERTARGEARILDPAHKVGDDDERPVHRVTLSPFYIDATEVTNASFAHFIQATDYKTDAEKNGFSWIFREGQKDWKAEDGADWRHPFGPESNIDDRMNQPVVNVSWNDALAFAAWAGKRLPTESEWEYAARGGVEGQIYPWGNELKPGGRPVANFWQGTWPSDNRREDGYYYTAPVASFTPNGFGLYDMVGNAWEWTADWYSEDYYKRSPPKDPMGPSSGEMRVARGGSWFCSPNYCGAYRIGFRGKSPPDSSFNNVGFRCAKDGP
ncbi:MAG: formylglycine-generating enzyme family protein [Acidobacteria bacterium]|nr:formylglycine-generating enzyme family protein [Acidobacteriota bacterium]